MEYNIKTDLYVIHIKEELSINTRFKGSYYEDMAVNYLENNGFKILSRNYKCYVGEIDIIAIKDNILRFIEVKYRKDNQYGSVFDSLSSRQQIRIMRAADRYLTEYGISDDVHCSFDVIMIQANQSNYIFNAYGGM